MNCLHLCNDFIGSEVHEQLYRSLNEKIDQTVFFPIRDQNQFQKAEALAESIGIEVIPSRKINSFHRILFRKKINYLYRDLKPHVVKKKYDIVHATTLFSDGALAYRIFKDFGIPYILSVRATDIDLFLKYRPDLHPLASKIINHAAQLIFISNALQNAFNEYISRLKLDDNARQKSKVIPNGIDQFWIDHVHPKRSLSKGQFKLIYIGTFIARKNVIRLVQACIKIKKLIPGLQLDLIGGGGRQEAKILKLVNELDYITFHGRIYDREKLRGLLLQSDALVMVSKAETFGLVYLEALSQGLPLVFSKARGIDDLFDFPVGYPANPNSVEAIAAAIKKLYETYDDIDLTKVDFNRFDWKQLAAQYHNVYSLAAGQKYQTPIMTFPKSEE